MKPSLKLFGLLGVLSACGQQGEQQDQTSGAFALRIGPGIKDLTLHATPQGDVRFTHRVGWANREEEFRVPYDIRVRNGKIFWFRRSEAPLEIGQFAGDDVQLCNASYDAICDMSFSFRPGSWFRPPVYSVELRSKVGTEPPPSATQTRNRALLDYIIPSPNQLDAGSCLFMANTGAVELLLNKQQFNRNPEVGGQTDLSERYLMNKSARSGFWLTDAVLPANQGMPPNALYPFRADYLKVKPNGEFVTDRRGAYVVGRRSDRDVELSAKVNWNRDLHEIPAGALMDIPEVARDIIYKDPARNQWNVAIMPKDIVTKVKREVTKGRPVIAVYNHYGYWHAVIIVGFDDKKRTDCYMPRDFVKWAAQNPNGASYGKKVSQAIAKTGCANEGVFLVRDSLQKSAITYDYGAYVGNYSKKYIERSYDWLRFLGNHAYAIYLAD